MKFCISEILLTAKVGLGKFREEIFVCWFEEGTLNFFRMVEKSCAWNPWMFPVFLIILI